MPSDSPRENFRAPERGDLIERVPILGQRFRLYARSLFGLNRSVAATRVNVS